MTPGEIGRSLERLEGGLEKQAVLLAAIHVQTLKTNGAVARHEDHLGRLDRDVVALTRDSNRHHHAPSNNHTMRRLSDRPDALTLTVPKNVLIGIGVILGTAIATAVAALLGVKLPL